MYTAKQLFAILSSNRSQELVIVLGDKDTVRVEEGEVSVVIAKGEDTDGNSNPKYCHDCGDLFLSVSKSKVKSYICPACKDIKKGEKSAWAENLKDFPTRR